MRHFRTIYVFASVIVGWSMAFPVAGAETTADLQPLPELIELSGMQADVRQVVETNLGRVKEVASRPDAEPAELAAAYGELGRAALAYTLLELPEPCFRNAETLDPDEFKWPYYLGVFFQDQRRLEEAVGSFERVLELNPGYLPANLHLAQVQLLRGEHDEARRLYETARNRRPLAAAALYGLGRIAAAEGNSAEAARLYKESLRIQPGAAEVEQQLGLAYRDLGDLDAARDYLSRASSSKLRFYDPLVDSLERDFSKGSVYLGLVAETFELWDRAVGHYQDAVDSDPTNAFYRQALAQALEKAGDLDGAIREHGEAVRLAPDNAMARVLLASAISRRDGITEEVVGLYREAAELAPTLKEARVGLGNSLFGLERYREAADTFGDALEIDPEAHKVRLRRAQALIRLGSEAEALAELQLLVERDPDDVVALLTLGQALARTGSVELALQTFGRALMLQGEPEQRAIAHVEIGNLQADAGNHDEALLHYTWALEVSPNSKEAHLGLAMSLAAQGRQADAAKTYGEALKLDPGDNAVRLRRAQALAASGAEAEAIRELERVVEKDSQAPTAVLDLAALQARAGDVNGAIETLTDALQQGNWEAPTRAMFTFNAATMWQQKGDKPRAVELYRQAVELTPGFKDAHFNLAVLLGEQGDVEGAVRHLERVVEIDGEDAEAHGALATILIRQGRFAEGRVALENGHRALPENVQLSKALVQVLVASPDPEARDPEAAVPIAISVHQAEPSLPNTGWVAAALAGAGRFREAAEWQARVVAQAEAEGVSEEELSRLRLDLERLRQQQESGR